MNANNVLIKSVSICIFRLFRVLFSIFLLGTAVVLPTALHAQVSEIDRLMQSELKMTFPSIYFKHNSTEYAKMPYTADSCFRHIALHFKEDNTQLVIWRDSAEADELTNARIKILKAGLKKYMLKRDIKIESMGSEQKVSRQTMKLTTDSTKINYLLSLNSVMDVTKTQWPPNKKKKGDHVDNPRITCVFCWMSCFHVVERHKRNKARRLKEKRNMGN